MQVCDNRVLNCDVGRACVFYVTQFSVNLAMTLAMTMLAILVAFHGRAYVPLWGMNNVVVDLFPSTVMPCIAATFCMTRAIAAAVRRGRILPHRSPFMVKLAKNNLMAGLVLGVGLFAALGPMFIGLLTWVYGARPVPFSDLVISKLGYASALTCVNTPVIIIRARAWLWDGTHEEQPD